MKMNVNTFTEFHLLEAITGPAYAEERRGHTGHDPQEKEQIGVHRRVGPPQGVNISMSIYFLTV